MWRVWAKSLGQKEGRSDKEADQVAIIRTLVMTQILITNFFIIAGNVKHLFFTQNNMSGAVTTRATADKSICCRL